MAENAPASGREILWTMPMFIDQGQRIRYESIALTTEIMEINLANLHSLARARADECPDNPPFTRQERALMFSLAWGIVDQADLLRQFIRADGGKIDLASGQAFLRTAETVRKLRNWMDHLPQRIAGYVRQDGPLPPAHGALSFTYIDPEVAADVAAGRPMKRYRAVVLTSTAMQRDLKVEGEPFEYQKFDIPTDHFVLQGFGHLLALVELVGQATAFCDELAKEAEAFCRTQGSRLALEEGRALEEVMKGSTLLAGTLVMVATANPD